MAYGIIDKDTVTPHRLHALLRLVARLEKAKRKDLLNLLQPVELGLPNQESSADVFNAARNLSLIIENEDKTIALLMPKEQIETVEAYRNYLRGILLSKSSDEDSNYLLNLFIAWYAVQNENVFSKYKNAQDYATELNRQFFPNHRTQQFDGKIKIGNARDWAAFLGLGWLMRFDRPGRTQDILVPDATERVAALLPQILPAGVGIPVRFGEFLGRLSEHCSELDGGTLFNYCWNVCYGQPRGNKISLMLSNSLRGLRDAGQLELIRQADATENWQLFPAYLDKDFQITHIRRAEGAVNA